MGQNAIGFFVSFFLLSDTVTGLEMEHIGRERARDEVKRKGNIQDGMVCPWMNFDQKIRIFCDGELTERGAKSLSFNQMIA